MQKEQWKNVVGYEGLYEVSSLGSLRRVFTYKSGSRKYRPMKLVPLDSRDYLCTRITKRGKSKLVLIHRLMAEAFIPNPQNKKYVMFKRGKHLVVENLQWADARQVHANYVMSK